MIPIKVAGAQGTRAREPRDAASAALQYLQPGALNLTALPPLSLYIHFPWCVRKCPYCDFNSHEAKVERDFGYAMARVNEELLAQGPEASRNAHFVCALAVCWPDGRSEWFEGRVEGTLVWPPRGENGFGYDPMFQPLGQEQTFGEIASEQKYAIDHRAEAFKLLVAALGK